MSLTLIQEKLVYDKILYPDMLMEEVSGEIMADVRKYYCNKVLIGKLPQKIVNLKIIERHTQYVHITHSLMEFTTRRKRIFLFCKKFER